MRTFESLGIKPVTEALLGNKIQIKEIVGQKIEIVNFRIETSKYQKNKTGLCLYLQVVHNGENRVVFTGSDMLIEIMKQVDKSMLPIDTKIIENANWFEFALNVEE